MRAVSRAFPANFVENSNGCTLGRCRQGGFSDFMGYFVTVVRQLPASLDLSIAQRRGEGEGLHA
jgi:hypothetical protein